MSQNFKKIQKHAEESVPHFLERIVALANGSISMMKFSAILFFIKTHNFFMLFPIELYKRSCQMFECIVASKGNSNKIILPSFESADSICFKTFYRYLISFLIHKISRFV